MDPSPPLPTLPLHLCRLLPLQLSTSISCRASSCNNACKMVPRATAHLPSAIKFIRPNRSYLQNVLESGKIVWEHPHTRIPAFYQRRVRKRLNSCRTKVFRVVSMAPLSFNHLHHIHTCSMPVARPVYRRLSKTRPSLAKVELRCKRRHRRHSRPPARVLPLPRTQSMGAGSIPPRMEANHIPRACHMLVAQTKPSVHLWGQTLAVHPRRSITNLHKPSSAHGCKI